jgi:L-serine dehydratase
MALAGFDAVIPLDEVILAMDKIGHKMPCEVRCTGLGGLSVTPTSLEIESDLESRCSS